MDAMQPFRFAAIFDRFVAISLRLPGVVILELWCRVFWENNDDSTTLQERLHDKVKTWMEVFELSQMIKARNMDVVMEQVLTYSGNCWFSLVSGALRSCEGNKQVDTRFS